MEFDPMAVVPWTGRRYFCNEASKGLKSTGLDSKSQTWNSFLVLHGTKSRGALGESPAPFDFLSLDFAILAPTILSCASRGLGARFDHACKHDEPSDVRSCARVPKCLQAFGS